MGEIGLCDNPVDYPPQPVTKGGTGSGGGIQLARRALIRAVVMAAVAMAAIDGIAVGIALPTMTRAFSVDVALSQWVFSAYLVTETSLLLVFGRVSEFTGKGRLFFSGLLLFTVSSLACGLSANLWELVFSRVLQASGSAMIFSVSAAILYETSEPGKEGRVMGLVGATTAAAAIVAPVLAGLVTSCLGWQYIFLINVPIGTAGTVLALFLIRREKVPRGTVAMDWGGAAGIIASIAFFSLALADISVQRSLSPAAIILLCLSLASLVSLCIAERKSPAPLVTLSVFRETGFLVPNLQLFCVSMAFSMLYLVGPFYLEGAVGLDPLGVGLVFLVVPTVITFGAPAAGLVYDRWNARCLPAWGIAVAGISFFLLGLAVAGRDVRVIVALLALLALGISLFLAPNSSEIMRSLPPRRASLASSVSATMKNLGTIAGVSSSALLLSLDAAGKDGVSLIHSALLSPQVTSSVQKVLFGSAALCVAGVLLAGIGAGKRVLGCRAVDPAVRESDLRDALAPRRSLAPPPVCLARDEAEDAANEHHDVEGGKDARDDREYPRAREVLPLRGEEGEESHEETDDPHRREDTDDGERHVERYT
ncbi:MAG: MFS transporter [Methanolinea sp.]